MPSTLIDTRCDSCDEAVDESTGTYCESYGVWNCEDCGSCSCEDCDPDETPERDSRIHDWSYRPRKFRPKGNYPSEVLLGVELEVGGDESDIADVVESFDPCEDHLYMKLDGSISGVEIVTHPMTLAWARDYPFGSILGGLRSAGCEVDSGYGLHIHVSRNAFQRMGKQSAAHQMVWLLFMYRNVDELERLARRSSDRWASFKKPVAGELARKAQTVQPDDRYVAVNCNNAKTFELRFFGSTLQETEFNAALEFADASVQYTRNLSTHQVVHEDAITWRSFVTWVERQDYRNLLAEIS
ncbi:amidoligase enzyme [Mycobacterium adipatum]|uniref:amidoligase enzyme n=1 Tax=Mycobacterium adipatum TaxID=1682113 RepID=UPI0034E06FC9